MIMENYENPKPKPGETQQKFISRCIPIVHKEHPDWKMDKVKAVCYSLWRRRHKNKMEMQGYELYTDEAHLITLKDDKVIENEEFTNAPGTKRLIAIIGDRFMNGGFVSMKVLKACYKQWEGSLHDINHMGTSTGFFLAQSDITYFIGYHKNVKLNESNKSVSMELYIHNRTEFAEAWEAYIELCEMAGKIPNVSTTYYGKRKFLPVTELPKECDWKAEGYGKEDLVPVLVEMQPVCVSTVLRGRCDDKGGCGIRDTDLKDSDSCDCKSCTEFDEKIEKKRQELISYLKKDDEKSED